MKIHFKHGSIVRFYLSCDANFDAAGKVIDVTDDEVVFVPQRYVSAYEYREECGTSSCDPKISVDSFPEIHLDRRFIVMWSYEKVPNSDRRTFYSVYQPSQVKDMPLNQYDEDGYCKGQGEFFE